MPLSIKNMPGAKAFVLARGMVVNALISILREDKDIEHYKG